MIPGKPQNYLAVFVAAGCSLLLATSCGVVPKDYPRDKPFVYETNINLEGNFSKDEKINLTSQLRNQLDDSMRTPTVYKLFYKGFNRSVLQNPPVYDTVSAQRSVIFMEALMNKLGYFNNKIKYDTTLTIKPDAKPPQHRTTVNFQVQSGKQYTLDSISFVINHSELQALTDATMDKSLLKKGSPFSQQLISDELNRLVEVYRDNGYMRFTFDELAGVWDTLNRALLRPTIDPFEQIQILEEIRKRRENPTTNLEIRLRPGYDFDKLKKYFVGHTNVYPDYSADTIGHPRKLVLEDEDVSIYSYRKLFKPKFVKQNIYYHYGDLYNQQRFLKTINRFNELVSWRLVNLESIPRPGSDTVDFNLFLTPAEKYSFTANLEGSFNNSNSIILEENLFGIGANLQLLNRNFGRSANQSSTNARYSTELDTKGEFVKTIQSSISHSIVFPKPVPNIKWIPTKFRDNFSSQLLFSLGNIDRKDFYNLTSLNASWGYRFRWNNKSFSLKVPNIEYTYVRKRDSLIKFLDENPSLKTVFPVNGLVLSVLGGYSVRGGKGSVSQIFRTNIEESGLLTNYINLKFLDSLFKFVKMDAEFIRNKSLGKSSFVFRAYVGAGFAMTTKDRPDDPNLSFFKQFSAGGPYSMRAWGLRTLGPGSALRTRAEVPIRFGDFQFETNAEYRFPLTRIFGFPVSSCLFTDVGNVWFLRKHDDFPNGNLTASSFIKDLAVGIGTGLRIDFDFFRLRIDYALKAKNPTPEPYNAEGQNKWFYNFNPLGGIVQLGINYPFSF